MALDLFGQPLIESPTTIDEDDRIALSQPLIEGGKNIKWSYFKTLLISLFGLKTEWTVGTGGDYATIYDAVQDNLTTDVLRLLAVSDIIEVSDVDIVTNVEIDLGSYTVDMNSNSFILSTGKLSIHNGGIFFAELTYQYTSSFKLFNKNFTNDNLYIENTTIQNDSILVNCRVSDVGFFENCTFVAAAREYSLLGYVTAQFSGIINNCTLVSNNASWDIYSNASSSVYNLIVKGTCGYNNMKLYKVDLVRFKAVMNGIPVLDSCNRVYDETALQNLDISLNANSTITNSTFRKLSGTTKNLTVIACRITGTGDRVLGNGGDYYHFKNCYFTNDIEVRYGHTTIEKCYTLGVLTVSTYSTGTILKDMTITLLYEYGIETILKDLEITTLVYSSSYGGLGIVKDCKITNAVNILRDGYSFDTVTINNNFSVGSNSDKLKIINTKISGTLTNSGDYNTFRDCDANAIDNQLASNYAVFDNCTYVTTEVDNSLTTREFNTYQN